MHLTVFFISKKKKCSKLKLKGYKKFGNKFSIFKTMFKPVGLISYNKSVILKQLILFNLYLFI